MSKGARDRREPKRPVSVAFYSYKGGTGRSLMLAQLAVCLARLGKSVCVLDFDLEAPGIEYKFRGLDPELQHPKCEGLAMYVQAFVEVAAHSMIRACPSCGNDLPWQLDPSKTLTLPIIEATHRIAIGDGVIHIVGAGPALSESDSYWKLLASPRFSRFFQYGDDYEPFFAGLKARIAEDLDPPPEYILVDSRSGVNELSGVTTRLLADRLVILAGTADDSLRGTNAILRGLERIRAAEPRQCLPRKESTHIVLSKLPHWRFDEGGNLHWSTEGEWKNRVSDALGVLNAGLESPFGQESVQVVSLAPLLHFEERLAFNFQAAPIADQISMEYVDVFSRVLRDVLPSLKDEIEQLVGPAQEWRPYLINRRQGQMVNPQDHSLNVAFRVDTQQGSFDEMHASIVKAHKAAGSSLPQARAAAADTLRAIGRRAARRFAAMLENRWYGQRKPKRSPDPHARLAEWCEFDSTVGFGSFSFSLDEDGKSGAVLLRNNFLTAGRSPADAWLCPYMEGYIETVLGAVFRGETVSVQHREADCGQHTGTENCKFRFKIGR